MIKIFEKTDNDEQEIILSVFQDMDFSGIDIELQNNNFKNSYADIMKKEIINSIKVADIFMLIGIIVM